MSEVPLCVVPTRFPAWAGSSRPCRRSLTKSAPWQGALLDSVPPDTHTNVLDTHTVVMDTHTNVLDTHTNVLDTYTVVLDTHARVLDTYTGVGRTHTPSRLA